MKTAEVTGHEQRGCIADQRKLLDDRTLPFLFFRRDGRFNLLWWMTGLPLFVAPTTIAVAALSGWEAKSAALVPHQDVAAVVFSAASIALISFTLGTHRVRIALWHQANDAPQSIVTIGAYRLIRHPFYTSFLLAMLASVAFMPHPILIAMAVWQFLILNHTASKEEGKLSHSAFGAEYVDYIRHTGRFFPRLSGGSPSAGEAPARGVRE